MAFLTGSFGPTHRYPAFSRARRRASLKYFIDLVNAIYLHGHALWTRPKDLAILVAWA